MYTVVALEDLVNVAVNERVSVCVKVVDMEDTRTVKNKYGSIFVTFMNYTEITKILP